MATDLADRHPSCIHRDDLVVEIREPTLVFGDQLRIECSGPISRHRQRHLRSAGQYRLLRIAVAVIGLALNAIIVQMLVELGIQDSLRQRLLQFVNQPVFIEYILRIAAGQKLVQQVFLDCHMMLLCLPSLWPHTQDSRQSQAKGSSRSARSENVQISVCSEIDRASSMSIPRYRTVLSIFVCPTAAERLSGYRCVGRSTSPWYGAASAFRIHVGRARLRSANLTRDERTAVL